MKYYYFTEPWAPCLMRALRKDVVADNIESGGHVLHGSAVNLYCENFTLKHYICLSMKHLMHKYSSRTYSREETNLGWHGSRACISNYRLVPPDRRQLRKVEDHNSVQLDRSRLWTRHFWELGEADEEDRPENPVGCGREKAVNS